MEKRGALSLSFGMIFSILMIVAILGIAFFAISHFLNLQKCTTTTLFHQDFQNKINSAWSAEIVSEEFSLSLPSRIKLVCFGDLENPGTLTGETKKAYEELEKYSTLKQQEESNLFLHPQEKSCDMGYVRVSHIDLSELDKFTCFETRDGKIKLEIEKGSEDALVKILE
tara:strand:- start:2599 stop:3105 length:507 start_codon:yes stop_codon:yes gene_type:complete